MDSPIWGTGIATFAQRLGQHTGIFRSAHATMVQIGTEMGVLGLIGYLGLFASVAGTCLMRAGRGGNAAHVPARHGPRPARGHRVSVPRRLQRDTIRSHAVTTYYWLLIGAFIGCTDHAPASDTLRMDHNEDEHDCAAA